MLLFLFIISLLAGQVAADQKLPRTLLALHDLQKDKEVRLSLVHQVAEMPLNHLGVVVRYVDIRGELPSLSEGDDVIGVISWLEQETTLNREEAERVLSWLIQALHVGKKVLIMGELPFASEHLEYALPLEQDFWKLLGLKNMGDWVAPGSDSDLEMNDNRLFNFEVSYPKLLPGYNRIVPIDDRVECLLGIRPNQDIERFSCLMAITPQGAYVDPGFSVRYLYERGRLQRSWYINPFLFFSRALGIEKRPRPDTTTLFGRRIFYSQIDGDGWNNATELKEFTWGTISATVLREKILLAFPTVPVTVAPIAADVDRSWVATEESVKEAKAILALENVETGCHTFTHPFDWLFFENYKPEMEFPYLSYYPNGSWMGRGWVAKVRLFFRKDDTETIQQEKREFSSYLNSDYDVPRAFALKPFDLDLEVEGAVKVINALAPPLKPASLYQWSGDCNPFYLALRKVVDAALLNINGGDTRFDQQFPSYAFVSPIGRELKDLWQIYASNSNENTYTNLWSSEFWGFNKLPQTFYNTDVPIRVKPMDLYYHVYSLQKEPSYRALLSNIEYILKEPHIRLTASRFSEIANGFYQAELEERGEDLWRVSKRGKLGTIRFDFASDKRVDFARSKGVIGFRYLHGSLYVHLDPESEETLIALKEGEEEGLYLVESSWEIESFQKEGNAAKIRAKGFGPFKLHLHAPALGVSGEVVGDERSFSSQGSSLVIEIPEDRMGQIEVVVK